MRRLVAFMLAAFVFLAAAGCRGTGNKPADGLSGGLSDGMTAGGQASMIVAEDGSRWLTHIYKSHDMKIPDGWALYDYAGIDYDAARDEFRSVLCRKEESEVDGVLTSFTDAEIAVWDGTGVLKEEIPLRDPERRHPWSCCFDGDRMICILGTADGGRKLALWDARSGALTEEKPVSEIVGWIAESGLRETETDGAGNLYASSGKQVMIISPDFVLLCVLGVNAFDMARTPDGEVWAVCPETTGRSLFRLNPERGQAEKITDLDENAAHLSFIGSGDGFIPVVSGAAGINFLSRDESGNWIAEERMNFANSGVSYNSLLYVRGDSERLAAAAGEDRFAFVAAETGEDGMDVYVLRLYEKTPDLDLSSIRTVTLAHDRELPDNIRYQISRFNREHDDVRVTTLDYSSYNNDLNPEGGSFRLVTDLLNGLIHPDAVWGERTADPVKTLMQKGLTVDLGPYLDADPDVNRKNIAGCVLRSFDDGNGGVWGIAPFFRMRTVVGLTSLLSPYADGWNLDGYIDFYESLPEGTILGTDVCRETRGNAEPDFSEFIGEDGCSFDSPVFTRYLEWVKKLPTMADLRKQSPAAGLYELNLAKPYYADGTLALRFLEISDLTGLLNLSGPYGDKPVSVPGYPVAEGSGTRIETDGIFVIPAGAPDPGAAWEFIRSFFLADDLTNQARWSVQIGIPAYLPDVEKKCADCLAMKKAELANGMTIRIVADFTEEEIADNFEQLYPGVPYTLSPFCTAEDVEIAMDLIASAGRPFRNEPEEGLTEIVREEISGYIAGVGTAEECAKKIQSRASIWLAENR